MLDVIPEIHARLSNTALLYFLVVSLWGYFRFFRRQGINSAYWGALAIAELLVVAEALFGAYLWINGFRPSRSIHVLYGALIPLMIPGAYIYTKAKGGRSEILVYGTATIITVGLILRASFTAEIIP
jgi:hypothetical protein